MTDENVNDVELDPMTEMNVKLEKMQKSYDELTSKFKEQSEMLSKALDSNMKLVGMMNAPSSSSHTDQNGQNVHSPSEEERTAQGYEEIVSYYVR